MADLPGSEGPWPDGLPWLGTEGLGTEGTCVTVMNGHVMVMYFNVNECNSFY